LSGPRRHAGLAGRARLLLSLAVRRARLLLLTGPVQLTRLLRLSGAIEPIRLLSLAVRHSRQWRLTGLPR